MNASTRPNRPRLVKHLPIVLSAIYVAQCLWFVGTQSLTYDEPTHVLAGLEAWRHGRFEQWNDQPPLARLLFTAPLVGGSWQLDPLPRPLDGAFWTFTIRPNAEQLAWRTRPVNVALGVTLGGLLWLTSRRLFSLDSANLVLALYAFSPPVIAHFSVATTDGAVTVLLFATVMMLVQWRRNPCWSATLALGAVTGGFLLAKFSATPLAVIAFGIMATSVSAIERLSDRLAKTAVAVVVALAIVWAAYFFHVGDVRFRSGSLTGPYGRGNTVIVPTSKPLDVTLRLPAPEYVAALGGVEQHAVRGQPSFFLGEVSKTGGWRLYYPVVSLLKWPLIVWGLAAATLVALFRRAAVPPPGLGLIMLFPAVFFGLAMLSRLDSGDRYILPAYPFLLVLAGGIWNVVKDRRFAVHIALAIVAAQAIDCLRYAPDYLSYFNALVPPQRSYELLTDSNLDWGQGLLALRRYAHSHPDEHISLAYFGGVDPRDYGIDAQPLAESGRPRGTVVVSATHLSGQYLVDPTAYHWLLQYPSTVLNHTLHVFAVPEDTVR